MSMFSEKQTVKLSVIGMHCEKCVARVTDALDGVDGVTKVAVTLEDNAAVVEGRGLETAALIAAVGDAGFEATLADA